MQFSVFLPCRRLLSGTPPSDGGYPSQHRVNLDQSASSHDEPCSDMEEDDEDLEICVDDDDNSDVHNTSLNSTSNGITSANSPTSAQVLANGIAESHPERHHERTKSVLENGTCMHVTNVSVMDLRSLTALTLAVM